MQTTFNDLVDNVRNLTLTEKLEIKNILEKSIIEEERNKIYDSYLESKKEYIEKKLKFSNDINELRKFDPSFKRLSRKKLKVVKKLKI